MLAKTMERWTREWKREGIEEGLKEGLRKGRSEGIQKGLQKGQQEIVQRLHESGMSPEEIAESTRYPLKKICELLKPEKD